MKFSKRWNLMSGLIALTALSLLGALAKFPSNASADGRQSKLHPDLATTFAQMQPGSRVIETERGGIEQAGETVRVVVNLSRPVGASLRERGVASLADVTRAGELAVSRALAQLSRSELQLAVRLDLQSAFAGYVNKTGLEKLRAMPEVELIVPDYVMELHTIEGRAMTRSDSAAGSFGYDGTGIGVAVLDSAFDYLQTALGGSAPKNASCSGCFNPVVDYMVDIAGTSGTGDNDVYPAPATPSTQCTGSYHGTGTAGIVHRYAPGAKLFLVKVIKDGSTSTYTSTMAAGVNWCVTNQFVGTVPIRITTMSIGGGRYYSDCPSGVVQAAYDNARAAGIISFQSAGNSGFDNSVGGPACDPDIFAVGSAFDEDGANYNSFSPAYCADADPEADERICYSNSGPSLDIYAPSEEVITETASMCVTPPTTSATRPLGGTSSASPAAAGCAAQILHARPTLVGDKDGLMVLMQATGAPVKGSPNPQYQAKRIDVLAATQDAGQPPVVSSFTATPASISPGGSATIDWQCDRTGYVRISDSMSLSPIAGDGSAYNSTGSIVVSPDRTTIYRLTAVGPGGSVTSTLTLDLTASGGAMSVSPLSMSFDSLPSGRTSAPKTVTVINTGSNELLMGSVTLLGDNASEFAIQSDGVSGQAIPVSGLRTFEIAFSPVSAGRKSASVVVPANAGSARISLSASSPGQLSGQWMKIRRRGGGQIQARLVIKNLGSTDAGAFTAKIYSSPTSSLGPRSDLIKSLDISGIRAGGRKIIKVAASDSRNPLFLIAEFNGAVVAKQVPVR